MSRAGSFRLRQPWAAFGLAGLVTAAAWVVTVRNAAGMSGRMLMPGGWSMSMAWMAMGHQSVLERAAMFMAMWTVMMVAMMLPSVMPVVMLHRRLLDARTGRGEAATGSNLLLLSGYFAVWAGFGGVAYLIGISIAAAVMQAESQRVPGRTNAVV